MTLDRWLIVAALLYAAYRMAQQSPATQPPKSYYVNADPLGGLWG